MLTRLAFIWTALPTLQSIITTIGIVAMQPTLADELPYAQAIAELKDYCIAKICLGATIDEVSKHGKLSFPHVVALPDGTVICSDTVGNSALGDLITTDGRTFKIGFELVSTVGKSESRYRLTSVEIKLPTISELQIDHLRQTLTTRYGLRKYEGPEAKNLWLGETRNGRFSISVRKIWARPDAPTDVFEEIKGLRLAANYQRKKEWVMTLPECRSGLPKI